MFLVGIVAAIIVGRKPTAGVEILFLLIPATFLAAGRRRRVWQILVVAVAVFPPLVVNGSSKNLRGIIDHIVVVSVGVKHFFLFQDGADVHLKDVDMHQMKLWWFRCMFDAFEKEQETYVRIKSKKTID